MSKHLKKNDSHSRSFMTAKQRSALKKVDKKLGVFFCKLDKKRARLNEKWTEEKWEVSIDYFVCKLSNVDCYPG